MQKVMNWEQLAQLPDSATHTIEVDRFSGWVVNKVTGEKQHYLSTHTFYENERAHRTQLLRSCGFDIEICAPDPEKVVQRPSPTLL
ncbi:MAG: hypothetical protein GY833_21600 [Aestuariibacter sp.]|nr:hypothetical protein [Aestuariibacter sp.]|tara:strand:+ start:122474 stop:122731 length:258 start_codon:yes stop_codon:yes gene_type:complete